MAMAGSVNAARRRKVGLALSSGVARGWAHVGAIRVLSRLGVGFDVVAGCSAGALVGAAYLAGRLDELEEWALTLSKRRILSYLDLHLGRGGLVSGNKIVAEIRRLLGARRIEELRTPFVAVATDLATGHEVWLRQGDLADAVRASLALPGLLPPSQIDDRLLADGALVDPLPVAACRALGADLVVAINLNTDVVGKARRAAATARTVFGFDPAILTQGGVEGSGGQLPAGLTRGIFQQEGDQPSLFGVMSTSLSIMQDRLTRSRLAGDPPDVHITPRVGHIGLLEFDRAKEAIQEGEEAVERKRIELADALQVVGVGLAR